MEAELRTLLYSSLKPFLEGLGIATFLPNDAEGPGDDADLPNRYAIVNVLPAPVQTFVCSGAVHNWIIAVNIYDMPKAGELNNLRVSDALSVQYPAGFNFAGSSTLYTVTDKPSPRTGQIESGSRFFTPVQFRITATS